MNEKFIKFGNVIFNYLVILFLLTISLILVIPFIPMYIGVNGYFSKKNDERALLDIFITIKDNIKIISIFTIFELVFVSVAIGDILYFSSLENSNTVLIVIGYVVLCFLLLFFMNSSVIIINMNVTIKQLLFNCITLIFGKPLYSIILYIFNILLITGMVNFMYIIPFVLFFLAFINEKVNDKNFKILKAKQLKKSIDELETKENIDEYYDNL